MPRRKSSVPVLEINNLSFNYDKTRNDKSAPLLDIDDFVLFSGERVGIVGDNGTGKSTIVKILLGLEIPMGSARLFGQSIIWGNHYPYLAYIGDPSLSPGQTGLPTGVPVSALIKTLREICHLDESLCVELAHGLGLDAIQEKNTSNLSNGERKKLMIFLALVKKPLLLIADEATDGLDQQAKKFFLKKLQLFSESLDFSLLWISHQYYEVARLTQSMYRLEQGKLRNIDCSRFACNVTTNPDSSVSGQYNNLTEHGLLEITSSIYDDHGISSFIIDGEKLTEAIVNDQ
jgi:ABC-type multidrug transport system ATPase subunit